MRIATAVLALGLSLAVAHRRAPCLAATDSRLAPPTANTTPAVPTAAPDPASQFRKILGTDFNGSALVSRDGDILFAEGIGMADDANGIQNTPETRFRLGSVTLTTSMAVLMLASQGRLKTTDPLCDYMDLGGSTDGTWSRSSTDRHSSGIASFTDQPGLIP